MSGPPTASPLRYRLALRLEREDRGLAGVACSWSEIVHDAIARMVSHYQGDRTRPGLGLSLDSPSPTRICAEMRAQLPRFEPRLREPRLAPLAPTQTGELALSLQARGSDGTEIRCFVVLDQLRPPEVRHVVTNRRILSA